MEEYHLRMWVPGTGDPRGRPPQSLFAVGTHLKQRKNLRSMHFHDWFPYKAFKSHISSLPVGHSPFISLLCLQTHYVYKLYDHQAHFSHCLESSPLSFFQDPAEMSSLLQVLTWVSPGYLLIELLPGGTDSKESACQSRRHKRCEPWVGKIPWRRHGNPFQYICLENPTDRGAWWATVHGVAKSWTQLNMHAQQQYYMLAIAWNPTPDKEKNNRICDLKNSLYSGRGR